MIKLFFLNHNVFETLDGVNECAAGDAFALNTVTGPSSRRHADGVLGRTLEAERSDVCTANTQLQPLA